MAKLSPSILSADFANLERDVKIITDAGADWIHVDVMDGHFVPNISFGMPVVKCARKTTKMPFDVHLMIENPDLYIEEDTEVELEVASADLTAGTLEIGILYM